VYRQHDTDSDPLGRRGRLVPGKVRWNGGFIFLVGMGKQTGGRTFRVGIWEDKGRFATNSGQAPRECNSVQALPGRWP
jgi:hypothetical protein